MVNTIILGLIMAITILTWHIAVWLYLWLKYKHKSRR
jgi:hypothetical protein